MYNIKQTVYLCECSTAACYGM